MNNKLIEIQEMLMNQMKRLDKLGQQIGGNKAEEISKANALSQNAVTFIKSVNTNIRIIEMSNKLNVKETQLTTKLGVENEK